eukprot:4295934-Ditylum_brightwellii.AAC.1
MNKDIPGEYRHPAIFLEEQQYQFVKKNSIALSGFIRKRIDKKSKNLVIFLQSVGLIIAQDMLVCSDFGMKDGVILGEYAEKDTKKSINFKKGIRKELSHTLHDGCSAIDQVVPKGCVLMTSHMEAMRGVLKLVTNSKGEIV